MKRANALYSALIPMLIFSWVLPVVGQEEKKEVSPSAAIIQLKSELKDRVEELTERYLEATADAEKAEVVAERRELEVQIVERVFKQVEARDSERRNVRDLIWFFGKTKGKAREILYRKLVSEFGDSSGLKDLARAIALSTPRTGQQEEWLKKLESESKDKTIQANAALQLSNYFEAVLGEKKRTDELDQSDYVAGKTEDELAEQVEKLLEKCVSEYASVKSVKLAAERILTTSKLKVGKVAPDIVGDDLDGENFKLSDYRGKVVVLDFWGDW